MWQRFTERARKAVFYAQEEAGKLGENYVSTEHMLLGLLRETDSVAARILERLGVSLDEIRSEIEREVSIGDGRSSKEMQLTPRGKRVIDLAYDEARQLNNNYIGTEHLLLGLVREGEGLAGRVLAKLGVELVPARAEVLELQGKQAQFAAAPVRSSTVRVSPQLLKELSHLLICAHEEAEALGRPYASPEHLLLAVLADKSSIAAEALERHGVIVDDVRETLRELYKAGQGGGEGAPPAAEG